MPPHSPPSPPTLTYEALRFLLQSAIAKGAVELDVAAVAGDLLGPVRDLLDVDVIAIDDLVVPRIDEREIRLRGEFRLPVGGGRRRAKPAILIQATFTNTDGGLGYTLALVPNEAALDAIAGELRAILDVLPVELGALWVTLSSVKVPSLAIEIPGYEIAAAVIEQGRGYLLRLESNLLEALRLEKHVFAIAERLDPIQLSTQTRIELHVLPMLDLTITRISLDDKRSITVAGDGTITLFGTTLAIKNSELSLSLQSISARIPIQQFVAPFDSALLRSIELLDTHATFTGSLSACAVGMDGRFIVAGSKNSGTFSFAYAVGATKPIPDVFELEANRFTISDAFTIMSGAVVTMPEVIDRLVVLERVYIYYATMEGLKTRSGVRSTYGVRAHADVDVCGYRAYGEIEANQDEFRAAVALSPISLGNVIEISGKGGGTAAGYRGSQVENDGMLFEMDRASKTARADIEVELLGQVAPGVVARLANQSIAFNVPLKLPGLHQLDFGAQLVKDRIALEAEFELEVKVPGEWTYDAFRIRELARVQGHVRIDAGLQTASARVDATVIFGPLKAAIGFEIDPGDLGKVAQRVIAQAVASVTDLLKDATKWLEALAAGVIEFLRDDLPYYIGHTLEHSFNQAGNEAAKALKKAGYEVEKAAGILLKGQKMATDEILDTLKGAESFAEEEIIGHLKRWGKLDDDVSNVAANVGILLLANGVAPDRVIKELGDILKKDAPAVAKTLELLGRPAHEAVQVLKDAGQSAEQAVKWVLETFGKVAEEVLADTLKIVNYPEAVATRAVRDITREVLRAGTNAGNELERGWKRHRPRVKIGGITL